MSRAEQYSWLSLLMLAAVFWWFQERMLDGWRIVDQPPSSLLFVYGGVLVATTLFEIIIASLLAASRRPGGAVEKDERDVAIEAQANQVERIVLIVGVNILVWQLLWDGAMPDNRLAHFDFADAPTLFFFLFAVLFAGEAAKRMATIIRYRMQSATQN